MPPRLLRHRARVGGRRAALLLLRLLLALLAGAGHAGIRAAARAGIRAHPGVGAAGGAGARLGKRARRGERRAGQDRQAGLPHLHLSTSAVPRRDSRADALTLRTRTRNSVGARGCRFAGCWAGAGQARRRASASQWIRRITSPVSATCQRALVPVRGGGPTCTVIELRRLRTANASSSASPAPTQTGSPPRMPASR